MFHKEGYAAIPSVGAGCVSWIYSDREKSRPEPGVVGKNVSYLRSMLNVQLNKNCFKKGQLLLT